MSQQPYYPQQPQQGPPPGYPQQPQNQYPGQQVQPQYGGSPAAPQGGAPSPFNQQAPAGPPGGQPWGNPDAPQGGGGEAPAFHQLEGRLCFFKVTTSTPESPKNAKFIKPGESTTEHLVLSEVVVLDGPPIAGNLDGNTQVLTPFSGGPRQIPTWFKQVYIRGAVAPGQLHSKAGGGLALGRVVRGTPAGQGRPPLVIQDATPEDELIAQRVYPMWDQLVAAATGQVAAAGPPVQGGHVVPPAGYAQAPGQPYPGQPYQQPQAAPQGPPPGWGQQPQQAWPQQGYPGPTH